MFIFFLSLGIYYLFILLSSSHYLPLSVFLSSPPYLSFFLQLSISLSFFSLSIFLSSPPYLSFFHLFIYLSFFSFLSRFLSFPLYLSFFLLLFIYFSFFSFLSSFLSSIFTSIYLSFSHFVKILHYLFI